MTFGVIEMAESVDGNTLPLHPYHPFLLDQPAYNPVNFEAGVRNAGLYPHITCFCNCGQQVQLNHVLPSKNTTRDHTLYTMKPGFLPVSYLSLSAENRAALVKTNLASRYLKDSVTN